jgi:multiple sugar transport system permease protein
MSSETQKATPTLAPIGARGAFWQRYRDTIQGYLFIGPYLLVYSVLLIYPMLLGLYISMHDWDLLSGVQEFVGIENYIRMFTRDSQFWLSTRHTLEFTVFSTPLIMAVGLLQAIALNRGGRLMGLFRTIFFASYVLSISVITLIWTIMLNPSRGLIQEILTGFGVEPIAFLQTPGLAMPSIIFTTMWWTAGFNTVIFLAGLQDIPKEVYEAAKLDGANNWNRFWLVTLPLLRRTLVLVMLLQVIASFQIFGQVFLMTGGGPANSTRVLVQHIYESGFRNFELGYASAMAMFLFAVMFVVSIIQLRITSNREEA